MGVRGLGKHVMLVGGARCGEHCADLNEWPPPLNARREGESGEEKFLCVGSEKVGNFAPCSNEW